MWTIQLLGALHLQQGEHIVSRFSTTKTGALLGYLALNLGRPVPRESLCDLLWPEADIEAARNSLRVALNALRKHLDAGVLEADRQRVVLRTEHCTTDVVAFESDLAGARRAAQPLPELQAAVARYRGSLLSGFYDEWIFPERRRLENACLAAISQAVGLAREAGDLHAAIDLSQRALAIDPLHESAHADLMRMYQAQGRTPQALEQYRTLQAALEGTAPGEDVQAVRDEIAARQSAAAVPRRLGGFFGRQSQRDMLRTALSPGPGARLITITGLGGIGKTALATVVLQELQPAYQDRAWLVTVEEPSSLVPAVARAMRLVPRADEDTADAVRRTLSLGPCLLAVDNLETLLARAPDTPDVLHDLLQAGDVACLVTSRTPVGLSGEVELPLPPLELPDPTRIEPDCPSVALFIERARGRRPDFQLTPRNADSVMAICRQLEGIPLALELAAAWSASLEPADMLARLQNRFELLVRRSTRQDRHASLLAVLESTWVQLTLPEQDLLHLASAFSGGWTMELLEQMSDRPVWQTLEGLRDRSLVVPTEGPAGLRFHMLETVRQFVMRMRPVDTALRQRHATVLQAWGVATAAGLETTRHEDTLDRLTADHDNLVAALQVLDPPAFAELVAALWRWWYHCGHVADMLPRVEATLPKLADPQPLLEAVGRMRAVRGQSRAACEALQQAGSEHALAALAAAAAQAGRDDLLATCLEQRLERAQGWGRAVLLLDLARLQPSAERVAEARRLFEAAGDQVGAAEAAVLQGETVPDATEQALAVTWLRLAWLATELGDRALARAHLQEAVAALPAGMSPLRATLLERQMALSQAMDQSSSRVK